MKGEYSVDEEVIDLREVVKSIIENKFIISAITALFVIGAAIYVSITPAVYQSNSIIRISHPERHFVSGMDTIIRLRINTDAEILKSSDIVSAVVSELNDPSIGVTTKVLKDTELIQLSVTSNSPEKAQKANQLIVEKFKQKIPELSSNDVSENKNVTADSTFAQQVQQDAVNNNMTPSIVQVVNNATLMTEPVKPKKMQVIGSAFILGILCGIASAVVRVLFKKGITI